MKPGSLIVLIAFMLGTAFFAQAAPTKEKRGEVTVRLTLNAPADAKDVRLWVPYPMSDRNQDITAVMISGNYAHSAVYSESTDRNPVFYAEWKSPQKQRVLTYTFKVTRKETLARMFPEKEQPFSKEEFKRYLDNSRLGNAENKVNELAADITKRKNTNLAKARAVYDWVVDNMHRDPNVKGCGLGEVDRLLVDKGGKCADIHTVFVALARAAGVPARDVFGVRLPKVKEGDITKGQHCWAEFYLPGYGWVVVDPADVLKYKLEQKLTPEQVQPLREYFFGAVDENRIAFGTGSHIVLNPPQSGGPLLYFMYPYAEADGKPLNEDLYGFNIGYKIGFKEQL